MLTTAAEREAIIRFTVTAAKYHSDLIEALRDRIKEHDDARSKWDNEPSVCDCGICEHDRALLKKIDLESIP